MTDVVRAALSPFGLVVTARTPGADLTAVPVADLHAWVRSHRVLVLRGFGALVGEAFPAFGRALGDLLEWDFGTVNELQVRPDARNYLYTDHAVPMHWDGAFVGRIPRYIVFHCDAAPPLATGAGGETLFADTTRILAGATPAERAAWSAVRVSYHTAKVVHYGGTFTADLLGVHPLTGEAVLRFAEPVDDLNPVALVVEGIAPADREGLLADLHRRLHDPAVCYAHPWRDGDVLLADNHALLHGRRAFATAAPRRIRRVNVL